LLLLEYVLGAQEMVLAQKGKSSEYDEMAESTQLPCCSTEITSPTWLSWLYDLPHEDSYFIFVVIKIPLVRTWSLLIALADRLES